MKYLHEFQTLTDFNTYRNASYLEPWVSYTIEEDNIDYNILEGTQEWYDIVLKSIPLTFDIISDGTIKWSKTSGAESKTIYYSLNGGDYVEITAQDTSGITINVNAGDTLCFKGYNDYYSTTTVSYGNASSKCCRFGGTAKFNIKGNIHSLLYGDDFRNTTTLVSPSTFSYLFSYSNVVSAKGLILPATTLNTYCYRGLFSNCTELLDAPRVLPAISTNYGKCYEEMFYYCRKLKVAPKILATGPSSNGYYASMFAGCFDLRYINCQLLNPNTTVCSNWANLVYPVGLFVQNPNITGSWSRGASATPQYWTIGTFCTDRKAIVVDEEQNVVPLEVISENPWEIISLPSWISVDQLNSFDIYTEINITIDQAYDTRNGTITFRSNDVIYNLPVKQSSVQEFSIICTGGNDGAIYCKGVSSMAGKTVEYSLNDGEWTSVTSSSGTGTLMTNVSPGDIVRVRSDLPAMATNSSNYITFSSTTATEISGNILSLINATNFTSVASISSSYTFCKLFDSMLPLYADNLKLKLVSDHCYYYAFANCSTLRKAPKFLASTLSQYCYGFMFNSCNYLKEAPELPATTLAPYCYTNMFASCLRLEVPPSILPATTLSTDCYEKMFLKCENLKKTPTFSFTTTADYSCSYMFSQCTKLTEAADLLATTIGRSSYEYMFNKCTSLTTAPKIFATTAGNRSCERMFLSCSSLINPPTLLATNLSHSCYLLMFGYCTSLTTTPVLPATNLAYYCYNQMFQNCTSLTMAPALPATNLANGCYSSMFNGCTSLTTAPTLPATTIPNEAYHSMFKGCTSLTTPPQILAESLSELTTKQITHAPCVSMFEDCTNLITAPQLSITNLVEYCYAKMFKNCTSLTSAPVLPVETLMQSCYQEMFNGCSNLNFIKAMFTTTPDDTYTSGWVDGVSETGTFIKNASAEWDVTGTNGIPEGWTVETASN